MKTISDILPLSKKYLEQHQISTARRDAEEIIAHVLKVKRIDLYMRFDAPLQEDELIKIRHLLKKRAKKEPLEYVLGSLSFFGCEIEVNSAVLIPRVETEILLAKACEKIGKSELQGKKAWDLCTGSGCIGIGLKKKFPSFDVILSDISNEALEVAKLNAAKNEVDVQFYLGDLLVPFAGMKADIVFANPPYVSKKEYEDLDFSVKNFEPSLALFAERDGYAFYFRLAKELPHFLNTQALLFLEVGAGQGNQVQEIFSGPEWKHRRVEKDWSGQDRFFFLEFE